MSPEARMSTAILSRLKRELEADISAMSLREDEAGETISRWGKAPEKTVISFGAVAIHAWYTALEGALERTVRILDGDVPTGDRWHQELLSQAFTEVAGVRPALLKESVQSDLLQLLSFRHFFRHAYAVSLDPDKVQAELRRLTKLAKAVHRDLKAFLQFLDKAIKAAHQAG